MNDVRTFLQETATRVLPRILTQVSRDSGAPHHGACDRNWWHYKVRDFPSIILQQAGYAISLWHGHPTLRPPPDLAAATARFWNSRAVRHGAFEEYYPWEQGYPPAAFSTLATAKLCHNGIVPLDEIRPGLAIAARQLLTRFEARAANQQIAGTAALAVIRTLAPDLIDEPRFQKILSNTLALQHHEGWFPEYDGPDLGYLSVSIDCLWDIHDHTRAPRAKEAIAKAADFIAWFALGPFGAAGMHNSRNTDYITPYGLIRLALEDPQAAAIVRRLFTRETSAAFHPFDAIDDRYWCHYIGHSVVRALNLLENENSFPAPPPASTAGAPSHKPGSGHALLVSTENASALVSTRKGAITTARWPGGSTASDFGWIVRSSGKTFVSHWWSNDWHISTDNHSATCEGYLVSHKEHLSAPWKHIVLRTGSFFLGRHLIPIFKRLVIFKKAPATHRFTRTVSWQDETLLIRDRITGLPPADTITRAPRASKRHVASANSYHPEDRNLLAGTERSETINRSDGVFECETKYRKSEL